MTWLTSWGGGSPAELSHPTWQPSPVPPSNPPSVCPSLPSLYGQKSPLVLEEVVRRWDGPLSSEILVLSADVGPKSFKKLSDICQKSVRKLSVIKMCQKTVINVSEFYQKTVRCKYLSELYQKRFGNALEMCQILWICQKTVSVSFGKLFVIRQNYHFWYISDTFIIICWYFWGVGLTIWPPSAAIKSEQRFWT